MFIIVHIYILVNVNASKKQNSDNSQQLIKRVMCTKFSIDACFNHIHETLHQIYFDIFDLLLGLILCSSYNCPNDNIL